MFSRIFARIDPPCIRRVQALVWELDFSLSLSWLTVGIGLVLATFLASLYSLALMCIFLIGVRDTWHITLVIGFFLSAFTVGTQLSLMRGAVSRLVRHFAMGKKFSSQVPEEVESRKKKRNTTWTSFLLNVSVLLLLFLYVFAFGRSISSFSFFWVLFGVYLTGSALALFGEYFLCTTAMPPEERKRRLFEEAARNAALSPT